MSHTVKISWTRSPEEPFTDNKYSRAHTWTFDGGAVVQASSSPQVVPLPMSDASAVDPEEAFIAAISSCHMLCFLFVASQQNYLVESYQDSPEGRLSKNAAGKLAITEVVLKPKSRFSGTNVPSRDQIDELHHAAHEQCFIANSVNTVITTIQS